eukprot:EG_transcript_4420
MRPAADPVPPPAPPGAPDRRGCGAVLAVTAIAAVLLQATVYCALAALFPDAGSLRPLQLNVASWRSPRVWQPAVSGRDLIPHGAHPSSFDWAHWPKPLGLRGKEGLPPRSPMVFSTSDSLPDGTVPAALPDVDEELADAVQVLPPVEAFLSGLPRESDTALAPTTLPRVFLVHLCAFLVVHDPQWQAWWLRGKRRIPYKLRVKYRFNVEFRRQYVRRQFQLLTAALGEALQTVPTPALEDALRRYAGDAAAWQALAATLTLLPAPSSLLDDPALAVKRRRLDRGARLVTPGTPLVALAAGFLPPRLLTEAVAYDAGRGRWVVPVRAVLPAPTLSTFAAADMEADAPAQEGRRSGVGTLLVFAAAGTLATLITNLAASPLDMLKTVQQTSHENLGLLETARRQVAQHGVGSLFTGSLAVAMICLTYGAVLYPGVELGKDWVTARVGATAATRWRPLILFCVTALCTMVSVFTALPWEVAKIRIQADPKFAENCFAVLDRLIQQEGFWTQYRSYVPVIGRSLLYNAGKFFVFDYFQDWVRVLAPGASGLLKWALSLVKGTLAGCVAVLLSQPMDVVVTRINQSHSALGVVGAVRALYAAGGLPIFYSGLLARILWAAVAIALQFFSYDLVKELLFTLVLAGVD